MGQSYDKCTRLLIYRSGFESSQGHNFFCVVMQDYLSYILSLCNLLNSESSMKKYRKLTHNGLARQFSYRSWLCSWKGVGWLVLVYCLICRHPDLWFGAHGETTSLNSPMDLLLDRNGSTSLSCLWINSVIINGVGVFDPFGCKPFMSLLHTKSS